MGHFRILESATGRLEWFETGKEYITWLLPPAGEDPISDTIAATGRYQWELLVLAMRFLPHSATFLDIGAYSGPWSLILAKARPDLRIDAYEPDLVSFGQLCGNIFLNSLHTIRPHNVALGARSGVQQLRLPNPKNRATATLVDGGNIIGSVTVQTLAETRVSPDLIKLSVNGSELAVLQGGFALLRQRLPILIFELPAPQARTRQATSDLLDYVQKLGYAHMKLSGRHCIAFPEKRRKEIVDAWGG